MNIYKHYYHKAIEPINLKKIPPKFLSPSNIKSFVVRLTGMLVYPISSPIEFLLLKILLYPTPKFGLIEFNEMSKSSGDKNNG
jgi:hypothetical protein